MNNASILSAAALLVIVGAACLSTASTDSVGEMRRELQSPCDKDMPLQVFLMMGQSNMVGMGALDHMGHLLNDHATRDKYMHLYDREEKHWAYSNEVHVSFNRLGAQLNGHLKADEFGSSDKQFGPEVEFGFTMERAQCGCNTPILIIKSATGGANLAEDFRPPSSGGTTGPLYDIAVAEIREALSVLGTEQSVPEYNAGLGYEIKGLVWFQGYNDIFEPEFRNEYAQNLINLIGDLRNDLEIPDLPVVVGELGMHGPDSDSPEFENAMIIRGAQQEAVDHFGDEVVYVPTAQFMNTHDETYELEYHYFGRADIVFNIGEAFANAMIDLLGEGQTE